MYSKVNLEFVEAEREQVVVEAFRAINRFSVNHLPPNVLWARSQLQDACAAINRIGVRVRKPIPESAWRESVKIVQDYLAFRDRLQRRSAWR